MSPTSSTFATGLRSTWPTASSSSGWRSCSVPWSRPTAARDASVSRHRVPESASGERLDRFVAGLVGSRGAAERLIASGGVLVDGAAAAKSHRLAGGEEGELAEAPTAPVEDAQPLDLRLAFEDEHLAVVDKPAGLVVHPGAGHGRGTLAQGMPGLAGGDPERPGIVHRLDRDTSGLLVVARSEEAYEGLRRL